MRSSTATKLVLGVIGAMALLLWASGQGREAVPMLAVFAMIGGLLYLSYRIREVPRRDAYRDTARTLGLDYEPTDTRALTGLPHPVLHRMAETRDVNHVLSLDDIGTAERAVETPWVSAPAAGAACTTA